MRRTLAATGAALALLSLGTATGCAGTAAQPAQGTAAAPTSGSTLDAASFAAAIERPGTVVVDVRTPEEFAAGHLAGAVNIDVRAADFAGRIGSLDKTKAYALYCHSGNRSTLALQQFQQAGFPQVYHLGGGITAWVAAGRPTVTG